MKPEGVNHRNQQPKLVIESFLNKKLKNLQILIKFFKRLKLYFYTIFSIFSIF